MTDLRQRLLDRAYSGKGVDTLCIEAESELKRLSEIVDAQLENLRKGNDREVLLRRLVTALRDVNASLDRESIRDETSAAKAVALANRVEDMTRGLRFLAKAAELIATEDGSRPHEVSRWLSESASSPSACGDSAPAPGGQESRPQPDDPPVAGGHTDQGTATP